MLGEQIRITRDLSFSDISSGKVSAPEAYRIFVESWLLKPARKVSETYPAETDYGMALLAILLMFFEPHGQFLTGGLTDRASQRMFVKGFSRFKSFLLKRGSIDSDAYDLDSKMIYKWARCGLFHTGILSDELLVYCLPENAKCLGRRRGTATWLIDPWKMTGELEEYLNEYVEELSNNSTSQLHVNFRSTFDIFFEDPKKKFLRNYGPASLRNV